MSSRKELNLEETQLNKSIIEERRSASANAIAFEDHDLLNEVWDQLPDAYFSKYQLEQLSYQAKLIVSAKRQTAVFVRSRKNLIEILKNSILKKNY